MLAAQRRKRRLVRNIMLCLSLLLFAALVIGMPADGRDDQEVAPALAPST